MKVLINNISWDNLNEIKKFFVGDGEIEFIEFADEKFKSFKCPQPYYVEENIKDLDKLINLCDEMDSNDATRHRVLKLHAIFFTKRDKRYLYAYPNFKDLLLSIKKQRVAGREISDIEYIYRQLNGKYDIKLQNSLALNNGYTIDTSVICGCSAIGKFELFSDNPDMNYELVFCYETEKTVRGKNRKINGHWHPYDYREAIRDVEDFMNGKIKL